MARIRTIKPEFFLDDELAELPMVARMLFVGLWTIADCEGRMEDRPKRIKAQILPFDDCDVDGALQSLNDAGFIQRYEADGGKYIVVTNFRKHQRLSGIEAQSRSVIPPPGSNQEAVEKRSGSAQENNQSLAQELQKTAENKAAGGSSCDIEETAGNDRVIAISPSDAEDKSLKNNGRLESEATEKHCRSNEEAANVQEGKGKERKGKEVNLSAEPDEIAEPKADDPGSATPIPADDDPSPISGELLPAIVQMPAKRQPSDDGGAQAACRATWVAYSGAYLDRYGVEPVRNAKVNAAIKGFTRRIGADESPDVARYYVWHADAYYARKCHDAGAMLADAEKLRTEWATKRQVTGVSARQQERSGTMCNAVDRILAKREATA